MIERPPTPNIAQLRTRERIEATPRAYVMRLHMPNPLPPNWRQLVYNDWMRACTALPTFVGNNILPSIDSTVGPVTFTHPRLRHLKPAPGLTIYGTAPWEKEEAIRRLTLLGAALCRCLDQRTIELLFRGRVLTGSHD